MGWETRGNGRYYYRKVRCGQSVRSVYVGGGELGRLVEALDLQLRRRRAEARAALDALTSREEDVEQQLEQLEAVIDALVAAALMSEGMHNHRGEWRRKREVDNG